MTAPIDAKLSPLTQQAQMAWNRRALLAADQGGVRLVYGQQEAVPPAQLR